MKILAVETSCDETSAAVVESASDNSHVKLLSNVVASSMELHAATGGIIPEVAARNQIRYIIPVISEALEKANIPFDGTTPPAIDSLAITYGPGLIGSLLVGVETVRTLSYIWDKPLVPVNHLFGHIYANFIETAQKPFSPISFPLIALIVSGGHTDLLLMKSHTDIVWLGGTRDDAAGEAFDKIGRLLNLAYPAGPLIEQKAKLGNSKTYHFPRPLLYDKAYDFSFSGLKTAVLREVEKLTNKIQQNSHLSDSNSLSKIETRNSSSFNTTSFPNQITNDICSGVQDAISDVLVYKTLQAAEEYHTQSILLSGGVAANQTLRDLLQSEIEKRQIPVTLFAPPKNLCTDNAAMIGAAAFFRNAEVPWDNVNANPELYFD